MFYLCATYFDDIQLLLFNYICFFVPILFLLLVAPSAALPQFTRHCRAYLRGISATIYTAVPQFTRHRRKYLRGVAAFICAAFPPIFTRRCRKYLRVPLELLAQAPVRARARVARLAGRMASVAQQFRVRFGAATLHLSVCEPDRRAAFSHEQAHALKALMKGGQPLKPQEQEALTAIVVGADDRGWEPADRASLLTSIEEATMRRRRSQTWSSRLLGIFAEEEWACWKARGRSGMDETLLEMINRVKSLGGKNLCEHSKKLLTAVWLHLRGDGREIERVGRELALAQVKARFSRAVRDFNPKFYLEELPSIEELPTLHPALYAAAYTSGKPPKKITGDDNSAIMALDTLMKCRGGGGYGRCDPPTALVGQHPVQALQHGLQAQQLPLGQQPLEAMAQMMALMMQQAMMGQPAQEPSITLLSQQPAGRPMRSLGNGIPNASMRSHIHPDNTRSSGGRVPPLHDQGHDDVRSSGGTVPPLHDQGHGDVRDDVEAVALRMAKRKTDKDDGDKGLEGGSDDEEAKPTPKKKGKKKKKKKTAAQATPAKVNPKKSRGGGSDSWPAKPCFSIERSRKQVMCRTGKGGPGSSHPIVWSESGGEKGAIAKAKTWLRDMMKKYTAHIEK